MERNCTKKLHNANPNNFFLFVLERVIRRRMLFSDGYDGGGEEMQNLILVTRAALALNERIGIANLINFRVNRSNMERQSFLSVSYQNKKTKDFFVHASPYSYCIAPVPLRFAIYIRLNR